MTRAYIVYIHYHGDTPIYVGTGKRSRAAQIANRNKPYLDHVTLHGKPDVEILYEGLTQELAWVCEELLIEQYKRTCDGGTLLNISTGGRGGSSGMSVPDETRAKISKSIKGKKKPPRSDEHIAKLREAARNRSPEHIAKHAASLRVTLAAKRTERAVACPA